MTLRLPNGSGSLIFEEASPCIEKIEHFGFVLPIIQL
jgi:hypothetical protein